ncbi:3-hydroxy-3-methylglutaryl-coenzyme A reductase [Alkalibacterium subtropicum]|uniref:3-hydroxy-3-methylglutaryl coenzyme A reductase n=1 Tax=Alkalibacterium subtropicum TaxID=753702 RepID=A0A1I1KFE4_9LACT|nr:hydroxymethylglutaryl-CoA reductase, degradative [Alkalibacterium subtropicum]SFC59351.1 3-hydroxy-3-methylglutaryl-coenzyme A reductase [Alkalibacterium subtropicum]
MDTTHLTKFYKKKHDDKIDSLFLAGVISKKEKDKLLDRTLELDPETGNHMIENYIGNYSMPLGVAMNYVIDGEELVVPMAIEEPSVIAASSFAAKIIGSAGGFKTTVTQRMMIGQVTLKNVPDIEAATKNVEEAKQEILSRANEAYPSIVKRGGGAKNLEVRLLDDDTDIGIPTFLSVHIHVDTQEAMGANIVNTMMEGIAPYIEELTGGTALLRILTNYATECLATSKCVIPAHKLKTGEFSGEEVRDRIVEATQVATIDPYRAVTHNKGIMNGVDAVVLASGNDWRAIEAGVHAYASRSGQYRSLTSWSKNEAGDLVGELTLPLPVGTVGGSISIHPAAKLAHSIMDHPQALKLEQVIVSVGLAQNFAAVRALVTEGIQKGHMGLHARSLAISAGAKGDHVQQVADILKHSKHKNLQRAKNILLNILEEFEK